MSFGTVTEEDIENGIENNDLNKVIAEELLKNVYCTDLIHIFIEFVLNFLVKYFNRIEAVVGEGGSKKVRVR